MDSLITAAARALAAGDPLGALNLVALRDDAPALALRGIAMAQLGDFARARELLRASRSARFGAKEPVARARCVVAEAGVALASRDLAWPREGAGAARATLEAHGDLANAAHARYLEVRRLVADRPPRRRRARARRTRCRELPPRLRAAHELVGRGHRDTAQSARRTRARR